MPMIASLVGMVVIWSVAAPAGWCSREICRDSSWEKIEGVKPESVSVEMALFSAVNSNGITKPCFERCERANCTAFVIDFGRSVCYSVRNEGEGSSNDENDNDNDNDDDDDDDDDKNDKGNKDDLLPETNSTFYRRICVKVPASCKRDRLWQVERTLGAILIDANAIHLPLSMKRSKCYQTCVEGGRSCRSAQFRTTRPLSTSDSIGKCTLSMLQRDTAPQSYRASMYRDEYLQNQCGEAPKREYCSYAEFRNATLPYSDVALQGLDERQCEKRCDRSADGFICRGYTMDRKSNVPLCLLHSENTISLGVGSLVDVGDAGGGRIVYRERERCLDLKVRCRDTAMTIELRTMDAFYGRIYASGYAETCGVQGVGRNLTVLTLPLAKPKDLRSSDLGCGLVPAFSVDDQNRTRALVWATIVVQFNPIIQRLGDQAIRVGCSLDDHDVLPEPRNVSVHSSFAFLDPNAGVPPIASTVVNVSTEVPIVTMRILNENGEDAIVTQLGQKLTLKIQIKPADGPYDIAAGHLVASSASGDASYLLLDEAGCPTDPATFPALSKDPSDDRSLISTFAAFKFPDSQLVRFNVIVRFCTERCAPAICRGGQPSYGKRRRRGSSDRSNATSSVASNEGTPDKLPLQLSIIVRSPGASADRLQTSKGSGSPDTVLIAGKDTLDGLLCVDASLALSLLILWLIVQIALIVGCLFTVARYRRMAVRAEEDRADILARHLYGIHGGNYEIARRVRWADRDESSSIA